VPDLTLFDQHCRNRYQTWIAEVPDANDFTLSEDTYMRYAHGILCLVMSLNCANVYKRASPAIKTEGPAKLIRNVIDTHEVDKWLLDICREVSRVQASYNTLFVPCLQGSDPGADDHSTTQACYYICMDVSQSCIVSGLLRTLWKTIGREVDTRPVIVEDTAIAPLTIFDCPGVFMDRDIALWRSTAFMHLLSFVNGAQCAGSNPFRYDPGWVGWIPRREQVQVALGRVRDQIATPRPVNVAPIVSLVDIYQAVLNGTPDSQNSMWLYFDPDRPARYNAWFATPSGGHPGLPPVYTLREVVTANLALQGRFPTDERHSKTPHGSSPQHTVKNPNPRCKAKKKKKNSEPAETGSHHEAGERDGGGGVAV